MVKEEDGVDGVPGWCTAKGERPRSWSYCGSRKTGRVVDNGREWIDGREEESGW